MSGIKEKLTIIRTRVEAYQATLVAVSKFRPLPQLEEVISYGQLDLGENRVQEMAEKRQVLPSNVRWHQIGTLQRNKVKYIAPFVHLVHSVENLALLQELDKQAKKEDRVIPYLLQVHIAQEETKFGLDKKELEELVQNPQIPTFANVALKGLMGMATNTEDTAIIRQEFRQLRQLFDELNQSGKPMEILSMGMSHDWEIALEEGSTMVRVGSAIFG
jgi:hypothetical protein